MSDLASPDLAEPDLAAPDLAAPDLAEPDLAEPDLAEPDLAEPDLAEPDLAEPDLAQPSVIASVTCDPNNVVTGTATMSLTGAVSFRVDYGGDTNYELSTPLVPVPADGSYSMTLLGLLPGATNHVRVRAWSAGSAQTSSDDLLVSCPALPAAMPSFTGVAGTLSSGFLLISVVNQASGLAVGALVDGTGRIYWYRPQVGLGDFGRMLDGNFDSYSANTFQEVTLAGQVVRTLTDPLASFGADNHELVSVPNQGAILFGLNARTIDTTPYLDGGVGDAAAMENTLVELDGDGGVVSHVRLGNQITVAETTSDINLRSRPVDYHHGNGIGLMNDGNLLVSLRHTETLYKIGRASGNILWRLGGAQSDFSFVDDPLNGFSHQHFGRQLPNGNILLFDNGNLHSPPTSRVVEYSLDENAHTATRVWDYRRNGVFAFCCGSTTRRPSGNTVTAWGAAGLIDEADSSGTTVWQMVIPLAVLYRAIPVPTLYP